MNKLKLRAIFAGDIELGAKIVFTPAEFEDELYFCITEDNDYRYPFAPLFCDNSWYIHSETGLLDIDGKMIYEQDVIETNVSGKTQQFIVEYFDSITGFGVKAENENIIHLYELKNIKINNESWFKHLLPKD